LTQVRFKSFFNNLDAKNSEKLNLKIIVKTDNEDTNWKFEGEGVMGMSPTSGLMSYLVNITGGNVSATLKYDQLDPKDKKNPTDDEL
jgi:methyltransferase-like protein